MSGGQDDAAGQIESSGDWETPTIEHTWTPEACELRRLLEACKGNSVLESQLKERIEDAEDARDAKAAIEEGGYVPYDEFRKQYAKENDVEEELDLSKPCEVLVDNEWVPCLHPPFHDVSTLYGTYVPVPNGVEAKHVWLSCAEIRNIRQPRYEPHTMESLLPLAGEWVHVKGSVSAWPLSFIGIGYVTIASETLTYQELMACGWATGPHAGKPVAREVK
jgi:hypothetical protein